MPVQASKLSPNFSLSEFVFSRTAAERGIDNAPPSDVLERLAELAWTMETVRAYLGGHNILITSGYRSPALNQAVGGVATSDHQIGAACDFVAPAAGAPLEICRDLEHVCDAIGIGQLIYEAVGRGEWVHLSVAPPKLAANRVLTIDDAGVRIGLHERRREAA